MAVNKDQAANGPKDGETPQGQAKKDAGRPSVKQTPQHTPTSATGDGAVDPRGLQPGEEFGAVATTNPPRGVGEPAADALADEPAAAALQQHVQAKIDGEEEKGYRGVKTQVVPNSAYTLAGVNRGDPTPETTVVTPRGVNRERD